MTAKRKNSKDVIDETVALETDPRWLLAEKAARSSTLARATQLREILLFIVRQTILTPDEPIHEFEIAHRVLGRRSDFNPLDDNIVRVQMAHLRKKLDLYFASEGKDEEIVITVALGSYKPVFSPRQKVAATPHPFPVGEAASAEEGRHAAAPVPAAVDENESAPVHESEHVARPAIWRAIAAIVILTLAGGCIALWMQVRSERESLDALHRALTPWRYEPAMAELWSGFVDSGRDTDIVLSDDSFLLIEEISKKSTPFYGYLGRSYLDPTQRKGLSPQLNFVEDLLASKSLGNTSEYKLAQRVLALDPVERRFHLYSARQYMPALVKQDNVILIGGRISNPWSELFEGRLNFTEDTVFEGLGRTNVINRAPASGEEKVYMATDTVGYCVVAYMPNPGHDGKTLLLEGTSSEATEAAGDFVLSSDQFSAFRNMLHVTKLPYFEVLLKTSQVRGTPLAVTIEAYRAYPALH
ncbi:MAG TPA: hypothetical protein VFB43_15715 [Terracidiphilus sp.]|nr:hypothetical protein [Terracidiphilus sp.]